MSAAGNIEAIRDWSNRYFYTNQEITDFFLKIDSGLTAYKLTILSNKNSTVNITEDVVSDPQTYSVKTDSSGVYTGLFFFTSGSDVTFVCGNKTATVTLTDSVMTINVNNYAISDLIPNALSMNDPNILESSRLDYDHSGFRAFDKVVGGSGSREFITMEGASPCFIGYHFGTPVVCTNVKLYTQTTYTGNQNIRTVTIQGSNDGTNWTDLTDATIKMLAYQSTPFLTDVDIPNLLTYSYLRIYQNAAWRPNNYSSNNPNLNISEVYFYGYVPAD